MRKKVMVTLEEEVIKALRKYVIDTRGTIRGISDILEAAVVEYLQRHGVQVALPQQPRQEAKKTVQQQAPAAGQAKPTPAQPPASPSAIAELIDTLQKFAKHRGLSLQQVEKAALEFLKRERGRSYKSIEEISEEDAKYLLNYLNI